MMAMWIIGLVALVCLIGATLWFWGKQPYVHKHLTREDLRPLLDVLLRRGYAGGFMVVKVPRQVEFVQFEKYVLKDRRIGLRLCFPRAPWSLGYYDQLKSLLTARSVGFQIESGSGKEVNEFLVVDVQDHLDRAYDLLLLVLRDVLELSEDRRLHAYISNASPRDEVITS